MKIKTNLTLLTLTFIIMIVAIGSIMFLTFDRINREMRVQNMTSRAFELSAAMREEITLTQQRASLIVLFSIIGFVILSSCISSFVIRAITRPLDELVRSTDIIGKGNLKHRVDIRVKNEIGELAVAFNQMTEKLRKVTASRDELNKEIVARKEAEDNIRRLSSAVQQSPSIAVITDTDGNIEYVNPKFSQITGYAYEETIGKNPRILKSGETTLEEYERMWDIITSGGEWRGIFHNKKKSGELYWEATSISSIKNAEGAITHFIKVAEDITERKKMEEETEKHLHDLEVFHKASIGREERIVELKREIRRLEKGLGRKQIRVEVTREQGI